MFELLLAKAAQSLFFLDPPLSIAKYRVSSRFMECHYFKIAAGRVATHIPVSAAPYKHKRDTRERQGGQTRI